MRTKSLCITSFLSLSCILLASVLSCTSDAPGLQVKCNMEGADVFLDGNKIGTCPVRLTPKAGNHKLIIQKGIDVDYRYLYETAIAMREGEAQKINAKLSLRYTEKVLKEMDSRFALVKGGCFQMGDVFGDGEEIERPVHQVCLNDFFMGKYEVTQEEWQSVMDNNPSRFVFSRLPVESISYRDAQNFIGKLNSLTGRNYRLPTEAEWEYAARSGGKREKWAGTSNENEVSEYAWHQDMSDGMTHFVGLKKPNGLGIYDMSGNVMEMVQDPYGKYGEEPQARSFDSCILRGGSFAFRDKYGVRVFGRMTRSKSWGEFYIGFRLARSVGQ